MNEENPEEPQVNEEEQPQREPSTFEQFKYVFPNTIRFYFFALESPRASENNLITFTILRLGFGLLFIVYGVMLGFVIKYIMNALQDKDRETFWRWLYIAVGMICFGMSVAGFQSWTENEFMIRWREALSERMLRMYINDGNYLRLTYQRQIDNPGQRITDDIKAFTTSANSLLMIIFTQSINVVVYSVIIMWLYPSCIVIVLWTVLLTLVGVFYFGPPLGLIARNDLQTQCDYRASAVRVEEFAEPVAFFQADDMERENVIQNLDANLNVQHEEAWWKALLDTMMSTRDLNNFLLPNLLLAERIFTGQLGLGDAAQVKQTAFRIQQALAVPLSQLDKIAGMYATTRRLREVIDFCEAPRNQNEDLKFEKSDNFGVQNLGYQTPTGDDLCRDLSFNLEKGTSMTIMAPSGSGKTTMLKTIRNIATMANAEGKVLIPSDDEIMFISQKSYIPHFSQDENTLRKQVLFPWFKKEADAPSDAEVEEALGLAGLEHVMQRFGGIHTAANWNQILSGGEQQRLCFARVFLARPSLVFLDESVSSLDYDSAQSMYQVMKDLDIWYISVNHNEKLRDFHDVALEKRSNVPIWEIKNLKSAVDLGRNNVKQKL